MGIPTAGMGAYVMKRQNTVTQYIAMRPILYLCEKTVRMLGAWVDRRWWDQEVLDLADARAVAAAMYREEGSEGG